MMQWYLPGLLIVQVLYAFLLVDPQPVAHLGSLDEFTLVLVTLQSN